MRTSRWVILLSCLLVLVGIAVFAWAPWRSAPAPSSTGPATTNDPRLAYEGPYQNIHPNVKYVGDAACADCHPVQSETYHRHPMGRSLRPIAEAVPAPPEDSEHHNPFLAFGREFQIKRDGEHVWQVETRKDTAGRTIYEKKTEVDYVIGSGNNGHSYLTNHDGFVFQTPISWYSHKQIWDLSPGWPEGQLATGRPIYVECLYCHANAVTPKGGAINRYEEPVFRGGAIGCERCHGPGEKHVAYRSGPGPFTAKDDYTIVNPGKLPHELRESVCQQCHLEGESRVVHRGQSPFEFRPGLPLDSVWSVFVRASHNGDNKAVNHVEQMYASRCFEGSRNSEKALGCISCHDPHVKVEADKRVAHYRDKCLQCHMSKSCTVPEVERRKTSKEDSCIDCHMPRFATSDIPHVASTNHAIPRDPKGMPRPRNREATPTNNLPIHPFQKNDPDTYTPQENRDQLIALGMMLSKAEPPVARRFASQYLPMLEDALDEDPADADLWEFKGQALLLLQRDLDALTAFAAGLSRAPDRETLLTYAAVTARNCGRTEDAQRYWERLAEVNPWNVQAQAMLTMRAAERDDWPKLKKHAEIWLELDPGNIEARQARVHYLLHEGDRERAKEEFGKIESLHPKNLDELEQWFQHEVQ